jgi:hypothetical protein
VNQYAKANTATCENCPNGCSGC